MSLEKFTLMNKKRLTEDVYELIFKVEEKKEILPGQFVIFDIPKLDKVIKRAYSVANYNKKTGEITMIIKNIGYGSDFICCLNIGDTLNGSYPMGAFTLKNTKNNKLFLATGTGFAPIYYMTKTALEKDNNSKIMLLFGLRYEHCVFYKEKLEELKNKYNNFDYKIFLSREMQAGYHYGYISTYLNSDNICEFDEFYVCGGPQVVKPIVEDLKAKNKENIYFESY